MITPHDSLTAIINRKENDIERTNLSSVINKRCELYNFRATTIHPKAFNNCNNASTTLDDRTTRSKSVQKHYIARNRKVIRQQVLSTTKNKLPLKTIIGTVLKRSHVAPPSLRIIYALGSLCSTCCTRQLERYTSSFGTRIWSLFTQSMLGLTEKWASRRGHELSIFNRYFALLCFSSLLDDFFTTSRGGARNIV